MNVLHSSQLTEQIHSINRRIDDLYYEEGQKVFPIYDGIVMVDLYLQAPYRLLWILKEPWDEVVNGEAEGGDWSMTTDLLARDDFYTKSRVSRGTWDPVIYSTYSILNGFLPWEEMEYIRDEPSMANVIRQIAFINIKKTPGLRQGTTNQSIIGHYEKYKKEIIHPQIDLFAPHLVIGCAPAMESIMNHYGCSGTAIKSSASGQTWYGVGQSLNFIYVFHPNQRKFSRKQYVTEIIDAASEMLPEIAV
jgi:hypothetical protein